MKNVMSFKAKIRNIAKSKNIPPQPVKQKFSYMFEEGKQYELWAYNIETILAEKVETILRRGVFNTRPRDFYDVFVLTTKHKVDRNQFFKALEATANHRNTTDKISDIPAIIRTLSSSSELQSMWDKYCRSFSYANDIAYAQIIDVVESLSQSCDV